jgi:prepilin peptidase CpaA
LFVATFRLAGINDWGFQAYLLIPLLIALIIAWGDVRTRRIPNYLTFGAALGGLIFQMAWQGWPGLVSGLTGLGLGFGLLLLPYILGGMGAGDVKALAALGAWLGPQQTFELFLFMAIAGGVMALMVMWWRGMMGVKIRETGVLILNLVLSRSVNLAPASPASVSKNESLPYGLALAVGMALVFWRGVGNGAF